MSIFSKILDKKCKHFNLNCVLINRTGGIFLHYKIYTDDFFQICTVMLSSLHDLNSDEHIPLLST